MGRTARGVIPEDIVITGEVPTIGEHDFLLTGGIELEPGRAPLNPKRTATRSRAGQRTVGASRSTGLTITPSA
jgi:hypothetical protein